MARDQWFFRLAFFAPYVVPSSAVCLIFAFMYTPETGLITNAFSWVGLDRARTSSAARRAPGSRSSCSPCGGPSASTSSSTPRRSRRSPRRSTRRPRSTAPGRGSRSGAITVPLLRPTMSLVLILQVLASLKVFDQIYILLAGGPSYSDPSGHRVHLRHRVHLLPRRLRGGGHDGLLRDPRGGLGRVAARPAPSPRPVRLPEGDCHGHHRTDRPRAGGRPPPAPRSTGSPAPAWCCSR